MKVLSLRNVFIVLFVLVVCKFNEEPAEAVHIHDLIWIIPALLLNAGLAAPLVLAVFAKLVILFKIKLPLLLPLLLLGGNQLGLGSLFGDSSSSGETDNSYATRHKRSVDIIQSFVGPIPVDEDQLLEKILSIDSKGCGQRLLCEVAFTQAKDGIDEDELALIALFSMNNQTPGQKESRARRVYRDALLTGYKSQSCKEKYLDCPFDRLQMMSLVHAISDDDFNAANKAIEERKDQLEKITKDKFEFKSAKTELKPVKSEFKPARSQISRARPILFYRN